MYLRLINKKNLKFKDFMKKYIFEKWYYEWISITKNLYPRDSKIFSDRGFVKIDNGSQGGSHWCIFIVKDHKS